MPLPHPLPAPPDTSAAAADSCRPDRLPRRHRRNITDGAAILRRTHQHDRGTLRHLCSLCRPVMPVIADPQLRNKRCPRAGALLPRDHCNFPAAAHSRIPTAALICGSTPAKAKHHHAARRQQQPKLPTPTLSPAQLSSSRIDCTRLLSSRAARLPLPCAAPCPASHTQIPHTTANAPNDKFRPQKTTGTLTDPVAFLRFIKRNLPLFYVRNSYVPYFVQLLAAY